MVALRSPNGTNGVAIRVARHHEKDDRMPTKERLQAFITTCERGEFVEALQGFYAEDATMQENGEPPRVGLPALIQNEKRMLERARFDVRQAASFVLDGDRAAINWVFEMTITGVGRVRMNEMAYQEWRGDKIARERFFYDPAQRKPIGPET
jgi:ketosteroid isomerase-like protein